MITHDLRWSLPRGNTPVPSRWQATRGQRLRRASGVIPVFRTARQEVRPSTSSCSR